ncbi:MAG: amino acid ABC transporter permease [Pseudomonadota bacterium]
MAVDVQGESDRSLIRTILYDAKYRAVLFQILVLGLLVALVVFLAYNTQRNLEEAGIESGFGFLGNTAGFDIAFSLIGWQATNTHFDVFVVGALNTLLVAVTGIICATIIGFIIGVLRLGKNWLVSRIAQTYIEVVRNVPLLLQILFWYEAVILISLPNVRNSIAVLESFFLSNRGIYTPVPVFDPGSFLILIAFIVAIVATFFTARWAKKRQDETGQQFPVLWVGVGLIAGLPFLTSAVMGFPWTWDYPSLQGFNFRGGFVLPPEFVALFLALTLYTAAFIAETVRAGIQSVSHGQTEAAGSLGLRPNTTMRLIVVPQAMRVIIPPLTSQYLNLTKNSSLGIAAAYPDIVSVFAGTSLNQTGQALEIIAITMAFYLTLSLGTSVFMNWFNRRIALVER